jgi:hypothetical protein
VRRQALDLAEDGDRVARSRHHGRLLHHLEVNIMIKGLFTRAMETLSLDVAR